MSDAKRATYDWQPISIITQESATISIRATGHVVMNRAAHHALGQPERVNLLIDRAQGLLGVQCGEEFPARASNRYGAIVVGSSGTALAELGLVPQRAYRARARMAENGVLYIPLPKGGDRE
jgi:hypothetical protein